MSKPDFFIVGAPKCGTTAMNDYLALHPDIFMAPKELHFFGRDLKVRARISEQDYLKVFEAGKGKKISGDASVWYLFSKSAASEIKSFSPGAKILIMLRNPVQVVYSLHSQNLYDGNEDVADFEEAISLDEQRKNGFHLADSVDFFEMPTYHDSVLFTEQVKRYFDVFGRENVHVILYDDFIENQKRELSVTLQFLGLNPGLNIDTGVVNANKKIRFFYLHRLLKKPPDISKKIIRILLPSRRLRHTIMAGLFKVNVKTGARKKISHEVKLKLINELKEEIFQLGKILERDLSQWTK